MSETTETAVVVAPKVPVHVGMRLSSLDEAYRLAKNLAIATLMPRDLRGKPADTLAIFLYGQDLGFSPMQSVQAIYVVKGKPQLSGVTWTALARRAGHKVRWGKCDEQSATVTITRADDPDYPHEETYTINDALKAALCYLDKETGEVRARSTSGEKLPWETYTKTMLRNRAISNAAKLVCPEVALGFGIEGDYDYVDDPVHVTAPEHHGDVVDADVIDATPEALNALADQFDFSHAAEQEELSGDVDE